MTEREKFEECILRISRGCADLNIDIRGVYHDPQIQVFWENWIMSEGK